MKSSERARREGAFRRIDLGRMYDACYARYFDGLLPRVAVRWASWQDAKRVGQPCWGWWSPSDQTISVILPVVTMHRHACSRRWFTR